MGLGPVVGVLGAVSAVSNMSSQRKAAKAQEQAIESNSKAAEAAAAQRYVEIQTAKDFAKYQSQVNLLSRQLSMYQQQAGLQAEGILDRLSAQQEHFANAQNLVQAGLQATSEREAANALRTNATQQKLQKVGQARGESTATQEALAGQAAEVNASLSSGEARRAMMETIMATATGQGGRTNAVLMDSDMEKDIAGSLQTFLAQRGISEQDFLQMLHVDSIASAEEQLAYGMAGQMNENVNRGEVYANMLASGVYQDIDTNMRMQDQARQAQLSTLQMANTMDVNADKVNEIFAEAGYQAQANANVANLAGQKAQLQAQKASIQKPGFLDFVGAGMQAFTSVAPLLQRSQPMQTSLPHQQPNHVGYNLLTRR